MHTIVDRDIGRNPISHITEACIAAASIQSEKRSSEMKKTLRLGDELVDELLAADIYTYDRTDFQLRS